MANTVPQNSRSHPGSRVPIQVLAVPGLHDLIIDGEVAHIDARVGARRLLERDTRILETFEHDFQQLPLLRVHVCGLEIVDAEEAVLELADVLVEEVAALGDDAARPVAVGVVEGVGVEPVSGDVAAPGAGVGDELPEGLGGVGVSG